MTVIVTPGQEALIRLLADGEFHSGEEIGRQLGVSRTAVWKQLQKLSEFGLEVQAQKGRGYCLSQKLDLLDREHIYTGLCADSLKLVSELDCVFALSSTNDHVADKHRKLGGGINGELDRLGAYVCLAEFQSRGRGRRGRQWVSPLACNLYMSALWEFEEGAAVLEGLSLAVGVAVARVLKCLGVEGVSLKWPNDIFLNGLKVGGILLEMTGDPAGRCQVVVGIGLNVAMPAQPDIDQPWTALKSVRDDISRNRLASSLIDELLVLLSSYTGQGFAAYREEWLRLDAFAGRSVKVIAGNNETLGIASGVADNGALLLDVEGVQKSFYGGELSLRLSEGLEQ